MNEQIKHYSDKLAYETDSWDLKVALEAEEHIVVIDARSPHAFEQEHIPGAINIPHRNMSCPWPAWKLRFPIRAQNSYLRCTRSIRSIS